MERFTDWLADIFHQLMAGIYSTLSPVARWIDAISFAAHGQLDRWGVPLHAQGWTVAGMWALVVVAVLGGILWGLRGRLRVLGVVVLVIVLARYFQLLPGV